MVVGLNFGTMRSRYLRSQDCKSFVKILPEIERFQRIYHPLKTFVWLPGALIGDLFLNVQ